MNKQGSEKLHSSRGRKRYASVALIILFSILALLIILPIWVMFVASFKPGSDLLQYGLNLDINVSRMNLDNYILLFTGQHEYWKWFFNSICLTIITVLSTLIISAFVGYGFAAYEFKGKKFLFLLVLLILSIPLEVVMLPLYKQMSAWKMMDSFTAVVLPFVAHASTIFFFRQYLVSIPQSLLEAGRIDGATEYGIFFRLIIPLMKPAFSAMAILNGMNAWNNYLWPLLVIRSSEKYPLTLGLNTLINPYGDNYSLLVVGSVFSVIPIFILFVAFQKYFIEGMMAGAVKG
ncbi:L-arabinose transport system permease protein AraQ [Lacrimispora xylanolytica]|uniref:Carbohydrate ABC transporter permease n=1 Tax=Lacrimispora xylanolytica TaxID=29375 RepID=A0ABY7AK28_9FIRM|nr:MULTISPECIES: carbohydrate ABC transporter permease [Clostridia]WAJ25821.1 carbohydrate ABC transporter permease [Lacrimispora xylanolytica]